MNSFQAAQLSGAPVPIDLGSAQVARLLATVPCGLPSPAEDHAAERVDHNEVPIKHPLATNRMSVRGISMRKARIDDGDVVLADRVIRPAHGHVVVTVVDNEFTVKRLWKRGSNLKLQAANATYPNVAPRDGKTAEVWGVVTTTIERMPV